MVVSETPQPQVTTTAKQAAHYACGVIMVSRKLAVVRTTTDRALAILCRQQRGVGVRGQGVPLQPESLRAAPLPFCYLFGMLGAPTGGIGGGTIGVALPIAGGSSRDLRTDLWALVTRPLVFAIRRTAEITAAVVRLITDSGAVLKWGFASHTYNIAFAPQICGNSVTYSVGYILLP